MIAGNTSRNIPPYGGGMLFRASGIDVSSVKGAYSVEAGETVRENVSGHFYPTVGRIVHVTGFSGQQSCYAAICSGLDHRPPVAFLTVFNPTGIGTFAISIDLDSKMARARFHDPRECPRLTEQPATSD